MLFAAGVAQFGSLAQVSGESNEGLVTGGVYRFSRNPQVVGGGLVATGAAICARSGFGLALAAVYVAVHHVYLIAEEEHMARVYGSRWEAFAARTPRILGRCQRSQEETT